MWYVVGLTVMPSRMSVWARRRLEGVRGDKGAVEARLAEMSRGGGKWGPGMKAEYGALMRELRRMEGLTDGLRLERDEFDEYLRKRREEDAKWRAGGACERKEGKDERVGGRAVGMSVKQVNALDELRRVRAWMRENGVEGEVGPVRAADVTWE